MRFSIFFSLGLSAAMTGLCYLLRGSIIRVFLTEPASFDYALTFTNILLTTSFLFGVFYVLTNALQAMGAAVQALIINLSRQGLIYIPALYIFLARSTRLCASSIRNRYSPLIPSPKNRRRCAFGSNT